MSGALTVSPANVVRKLLVDLSLGTNVADAGTWPVFAVRLPDTPDSLIAVFDTAPRTEGRTQTDGQVQERYGIQVMVRGATHDVGYTKISSILNTLATQVANDTVVIGNTTFTVYALTNFSGVLSLGQEPETKRMLFSLNFQAVLDQVS